MHAILRFKIPFLVSVRSLVSWWSSLGRSDVRKEVDQVAIRIAKEHRPATPGLIGGFKDEMRHQAPQPTMFLVNIFDFEIEYQRAIRPYFCSASIENIHAALAG